MRPQHTVDSFGMVLPLESQQFQNVFEQLAFLVLVAAVRRCLQNGQIALDLSPIR